MDKCFIIFYKMKNLLESIFLRLLNFIFSQMQRSFIKRPFYSQQKPVSSDNIFNIQQSVHLPPLPQLAHPQIQSFHFVGPSHLRQQIIKEAQEKNNNDEKVELLEERRSLMDLSRSMQTTIKRQSVMSKLSQYEKKEITKDERNIQYYKDYLAIWKKENERIRRNTGKGMQPTLIQKNVQKLQVLPNPQKDDIVRVHVNSYWQMSLRNNSLVLKGHLKGQSRYSQVELEQLLQRDEGRKAVESAIPKLPIQKLKNTDYRQFSLSGRNKLARQSQSCDPSVMSQYTSRLSKPHTQRPSDDSQYLKMNYDSAHRFLKDESLG